MLLDILFLAATQQPSAPPDLWWVYVLVPALFGGYGIATIIQHLTKRKSEAEGHKLEGTRLGQDIMEKALIRLDKELGELRVKDELREREREADKAEFEAALQAERERVRAAEETNNALVRYLTKFINYIKAGGGTVPLVDPADEPYLAELSKFAKVDNNAT